MSTVAQSTKQLFNFKGNFKEACLAINDAAGLTDSYLERSTEFVKQKARIEINFDLGEAMNQEVLQPGGQTVYDFFNARLRHRVCTARREDQVTAVAGIRDIHDEFVSTLLATYEERLAPFTEALLPYYAVKTIRPLGTRSDLNIAFWEDFTDVEFLIEFGIRSTAWPVSP